MMIQRFYLFSQAVDYHILLDHKSTNMELFEKIGLIDKRLESGLQDIILSIEQLSIIKQKVELILLEYIDKRIVSNNKYLSKPTTLFIFNKKVKLQLRDEQDALINKLNWLLLMVSSSIKLEKQLYIYDISGLENDGSVLALIKKNNTIDDYGLSFKQIHEEFNNYWIQKNIKSRILDSESVFLSLLRLEDKGLISTKDISGLIHYFCTEKGKRIIL